MRRLIIATTAMLTACASVQRDPGLGVAVTAAPFEASIGPFGHTEVPLGSTLIGARVDGKAAFCTTRAAYFVPGEQRAICLMDTHKSGYFDSYYILGTTRQNVFAAHVPYTIAAASSYAAAPVVTQADAARCEYEAAAAASAVRGSLTQAAQQANLRNLCLRAAAAKNGPAP